MNKKSTTAMDLLQRVAWLVEGVREDGDTMVSINTSLFEEIAEFVASAPAEEKGKP